MRRIVLLLLLLSLVLAGCGGAPADTTVEAPPQSEPFAESTNPKINEIISGWKSSVPATLQQYQIKPETIEEQVYESTASLEEVESHYAKLIEKGWYQVPRMPGIQEGTFLSGYESGTTTLVIGALDASQLGGSGVVIYTAKGSK
jgi:hypothetical protein